MNTYKIELSWYDENAKRIVYSTTILSADDIEDAGIKLDEFYAENLDYDIVNIVAI